MEKKSVGRPSNGPKTKVQLFLLDAFIAGRKSPEVANEINEWYLGNTKLGNKVIRNTPEIELPTTKLTNKVIPNSEHTIQAIEAREPELKAQMDQVYGPQWGAGFTELERNMCDTIVRNYAKSGNKTMFVQRVTSVKWE